MRKYVTKRAINSIIISLVLLNLLLYLSSMLFSLSVMDDNLDYNAIVIIFIISNIFVLCMHINILVTHAKSLKKLPYREIFINQGINQHREINFQVDITQLYDICMESLTNFTDSEIASNNQEQGIIKALTCGVKDIRVKGLFTCQIVEIRLESINTNETKLSVDCRPSRFWIYADYGATLLVAETLIEVIREQLIENTVISELESKN